MERYLAFSLVEVTEAAALEAAKFLGRGDKIAADQAAVDAMRNVFNCLDIDGTVVIGEGELDEAPMLYIGERVGLRNPDSIELDIAVEPVEATTSLSLGLNNSIAVVAVAPRGCLLNAPDMYMSKIAVGPKAKGAINLDLTVKENLINVAKALNKDIRELTVATQYRERHEYIVQACREVGAKMILFDNKLYLIDDLVKGDESYFAATGISNGDMLRGVIYKDNNTAITHSMVISNKKGMIRFVESVHRLDR